MEKKLFKLRGWFIFLTIICIASCRNPVMRQDVWAIDESELDQPLPRSLETDQQAKDMALQFITNWLETTASQGQGNWNKNTNISKVTPLYNDGLTLPSYYECKAISNGADAGYVLITIDNSDILIPEFATSGPSLTDSVTEKLGSDKYILYRYGYLGIRAVPKVFSAANFENPAEQNSIYVDGVKGFDNDLSKWRAKLRSDGVTPYYSRRYFNYLRLNNNRMRNQYKTGNSKSTQSYISEFAALRFETPSWYQFYTLGSNLNQKGLEPAKAYPIGCGPIAWAEVYGYWQAYKGKVNLFPGINIDNVYSTNGFQTAYSVQGGIRTMAYLMNTVWGNSNGTYGLTDPANMNKGIDYASSYYPGSTVERTLNALFQFAMFDKVYAAISADRPCIISIYSNNGTTGIGPWVTHYVVVEEAKKTRYRKSLGSGWWPWADGSTNYKVNMGWGNSSNNHRYICTCDVDPEYIPQGTLTSMWDVWDIKVK